MFEPKIKIKKSLFDKAKMAAEVMGCASVDEFVEKIVETETSRVLNKGAKNAATQAEVQDIANKLKGLGYLE